MHVRLKTELPCRPEAAWELLRSPEAMRASMFPVFTIRATDGRLPERWSTGAFRVRLRLFGVIPVGEQIIDLTFGERRGVRMMTDAGGPVSGPLAVVTEWRHRMAVAPSRREDGTLYRDELHYRAGPLGLALWPGVWLLWQWRSRRMRRLAARSVG